MKNSGLLMIMLGLVVGLTITHTFSSAKWMTDQKNASQAQTKQIKQLEQKLDKLSEIYQQCKPPTPEAQSPTPNK